MVKGRLAVLCLVAVSLLMVYGVASAGIIDPCVSYCMLSATGGAAGPPFPLFSCPQGDTDVFVDQVGGTGSGVGFLITVCVLQSDGTPIPNIPPSDFWLVDCDPINDAVLCGGSASSGADSLTNAAGMTTLGGLGTLTAGGCADGLTLVVQGFAIQDSLTNCTTAVCKPIDVRSPDIDGNLLVNLQDLSIFATSFPPNPLDPCCDFDINGIVNLQDLAKFAFHFGPPGHQCN